LLIQDQHLSVTFFVFCWFKINIWASPAFSIASLCLSTTAKFLIL
jgi:hypothetical protein